MTRERFLAELSEALRDLPEKVRKQNLRYYEGYIEEEIRRGRTEREVLSELGDPRWIAKSVREAEGGRLQRDGGFYGYDGDSKRETHRGSGWFRGQLGGHRLELRGWLALALLAGFLLLLLMVVSLIFRLFFSGVFFALWLLTRPLFWVIVFLVAAYGYFRRRRW